MPLRRVRKGAKLRFIAYPCSFDILQRGYMYIDIVGSATRCSSNRNTLTFEIKLRKGYSDADGGASGWLSRNDDDTVMCRRQNVGRQGIQMCRARAHTDIYRYPGSRAFAIGSSATVRLATTTTHVRDRSIARAAARSSPPAPSPSTPSSLYSPAARTLLSWYAIVVVERRAETRLLRRARQRSPACC